LAAPGSIYTSSGTTLFGGQGTSVTLQYAGNGVWQPVNLGSSASAPNTVVTRDASGNIAAAIITASALSSTGAVSAASFVGDGSGLTNLPVGWKLSGNSGTSPATNFLGTTDLQPLEFRVNNSRVLRLEPNTNGPNAIGGYAGNFVDPNSYGATIGGGGATPVNGGTNTILGIGGYSTIAGGVGNICGASNVSMGYATIGGGTKNLAGNISTTVGGGSQNSALGFYSTVAGGWVNTASGTFATTVSGGRGNIASGDYSTIAGGYSNSASGQLSFAAGNQAQANHNGAFVWADASAGGFGSTKTNQFSVRANGGVRLQTGGAGMTLDGNFGIGTTNPVRLLQVGDDSVTGSTGMMRFGSRTSNPIGGANRSWDIGVPQLGDIVTNGSYDFVINDATQNSNCVVVAWQSGYVGIGNVNPTNKLMVVNARCDGNSWISASDRNLKQDFASVDSLDVLSKVTSMQVQSWSYKSQPQEKHVGPVAQDFYSAFGLGADDKSIATVDESGVALAAIQGLNQKLELKLQQKETQISELRHSVAELHTLVQQLISRQKGESQ
jgi:hypothetical protein